MEGKDVMSRNVCIYKAQASTLEQYAAPQCKVKNGVHHHRATEGATIIKARKLSSVLSAASSACDHLHDWVIETPKGTWVSMGISSEGSYGIPPDLIYSFSVTRENGEWSIIQGLKIDEFSTEKMDATVKELMEEKSLAYSCLN
ncbi:UNVERIFIED_CONTAM: Malate dehydrogenase, cytoplasmic [Sesamum radiatum]|uniref:Malate dehydrogenase, cytoplasmic n=1 Tax=Sesamum radiatum TaxID=300843 RepID=A0AAW2R0E9_SESRA